MAFNEIYYWLIQSERRKNILVGFDQPLTATHIARRAEINLDACLHLIWGMTVYGVIYCLDTDTHHNRLYWLTELGKTCQRKFRGKMGLHPLAYHLPNIPWNLYSSVCYSHRSAVIKAMHEPMQAAAIKRKALSQNPKLRMSANNVRDVMKYLLKHGIVRKVIMRKKKHPRYELTDLGNTFKVLLVGACVRCMWV